MPQIQQMSQVLKMDFQTRTHSAPCPFVASPSVNQMAIFDNNRANSNTGIGIESMRASLTFNRSRSRASNPANIRSPEHGLPNQDMHSTMPLYSIPSPSGPITAPCFKFDQTIQVLGQEIASHLGYWLPRLAADMTHPCQHLHILAIPNLCIFQ